MPSLTLFLHLSPPFILDIFVALVIMKNPALPVYLSLTSGRESERLASTLKNDQ